MSLSAKIAYAFCAAIALTSSPTIPAEDAREGLTGDANAERRSTNKKLFLEAAATLGRSMESDTAVIASMVEAVIEPKPYPVFGRPAATLARYRAEIDFPRSGRIVSSLRYEHDASPNGTYVGATVFRLNSDPVCISKEDVDRVFGPATAVRQTKGSHLPIGSKDWIYTNGDVNKTVTFLATPCAVSLAVSVYRVPKRTPASE